MRSKRYHHVAYVLRDLAVIASCSASVAVVTLLHYILCFCWATTTDIIITEAVVKGIGEETAFLHLTYLQWCIQNRITTVIFSFHEMFNWNCRENLLQGTHHHCYHYQHNRLLFFMTLFRLRSCFLLLCVTLHLLLLFALLFRFFAISLLLLLPHVDTCF